MLVSKKPSRARFLSVVAATTISLACGTNYVYSAWGPQFAQRLKLNATESNLIGTCGNFGNYGFGIPLGMVVDAKGPRWGVALGILMFAIGYYPLARAFDAGPGVYSLWTLCLFSLFTGAGSAAAFIAAIKAAALNFPTARGTATAFPLAAYGLSAFFFATVALAFPHDTSHFLIVLATGTVALPTISFPFLQTTNIQQDYKAIPSGEVSALRRRRSSTAGQQRLFQPDTGAQESLPQPTSSFLPQRPKVERRDSDDTSSLLSEASSEAIAELEATKNIEDDRKAETHDLDIRGFALVRHVEFWQLFSLLGLLAGIGLMTINNIGNDVQALWQRFDPSVTGAFVAKRQVAHVSTLSICSFTGRLLSGVGSDILVNKFNRSRYWCLMISISLFAMAQLLATFIELPDLLILVAGITGIAYGFVFGVFPSLIAHAFGLPGMSQNWGTVCLAPMIGGNVFNLLYGRVYDSHSVVDEKGDRKCTDGRDCYSKSYLVTWTASLFGILLCFWTIHHENQAYKRRFAHERSA